MSDYLSARKRKQVEEMKRRIREGEVVSYQVTVYDIIANAIYEDEQGPWSLEDPYTEWEIATYELALEAHDREVAAGALRDAADEWSEWETFTASDGNKSIRMHGLSPDQWLRARAVLEAALGGEQDD